MSPLISRLFCIVSLLGLAQGAEAAIFVLKNISDKSVLLDRYRRHNPGVSAGWASMIAPKHCSAIQITEPRFTFICRMKNKQGNYQKINCKKVIKVWAIQYTTHKTKKTTQGSYWITENKPCRAFGTGMGRRYPRLRSLCSLHLGLDSV